MLIYQSPPALSMVFYNQNLVLVGVLRLPSCWRTRKQLHTNTSPTSIFYGSNKNVWWLCSKGHSYAVKVRNRTFNNGGCPYCSNTKALQDFNDLETWCKENNRSYLLEECDCDKDTLFSSEISKMSNKKISKNVRTIINEKL